jgi:Outer membrane protein beta-barrel domain
MTRFVLLFLLIAFQVSGQNKKKPSFNNKARSDQNKFLEKQWWLGFKAGVNLSDVIPEKRYTVLTPTNYPASSTDKTYDSYNKTGSQVCLEITFYYKGFSFSTQPMYKHSRFTYANQFNWTNPENSAERLEMKFDQEQQIDFADFPLLVKYEFTGNKLRPYIQAGAFYSFLVDANKSVKVSGVDYASGGTNAFANEPVIVGAKDLFENYWGLIGGAGVNYNLGNVRLVLDVSYRHGMSNIANVDNRFSNDRLNGIGDAQDDLLLRNITISAGCLFPLRFLSNSFKALD